MIVVGDTPAELQRWFARVDLAATVDNGIGLDNDEQGTPVWVVTEPRLPWPQLRRIG